MRTLLSLIDKEIVSLNANIEELSDDVHNDALGDDIEGFEDEFRGDPWDPKKIKKWDEEVLNTASDTKKA